MTPLPSALSAPSRSRFERRGTLDFPDVELHVPRMLAVARGIVSSDDLAWDAVQETLLRLWHEEREPRDLRGWLVRAVTRRSLGAARSLRRRRYHEQRFSVARPTASSGHPEDELELHALASLVSRALDSLPREYAEAFRLHELEGLDYPSAAARLAVPIGTVRSRIHRARRALRSSLARLVHEERSCSICAGER
jgi:RNA polymerase sigma-70 factor (ECF subfamily)